MYTLEQIERIWQTSKPLAYRLVEGEKANGLHRNSDAYEFKKADNITEQERATQSQALWERFVQFLDMINDGVYTVVLMSSKTASSSAAPYMFGKGDPSTWVTKKSIGSVSNQPTDSGGNWGMSLGGQSPMMLMIQMMQQQNAQQMAMMQQSNAQQTAMMQQLFQKDMEIHKMGQAKDVGDRVFGLLEKPHVWGLLSKFAPAQTAAIGRAQAMTNEPVPRSDEQTVSEPQQESVNRLKNLLEKVAAQNPGEDPIRILDEGFDQVQAFLAMQG